MRRQKRIFCFGLMGMLVWLIPVTSSAGAAPQETGAGEKNQPVALPAAREELLGELSDEPKDVAEVVLSNDGIRFAAKIKRGKQWVLVVDGKEGPVSEDFAGISFSRPGARHIIYAVKRSGKWTEMLDDKELGPAFDALIPDPSKNPRNATGPMWMPPPASPGSVGSMLNGLDAAGMLYTALNTRYSQPVAPTAKDASREMEGSSWFWQNDNLQRHAYAGRRGKTSLMFIDGKEGPEFADISPPYFSPDGKRLAYWAKRQTKKGTGGSEVYVISELIVADGKEGPEFDDVGPPVFSPDSMHLAYWAKGKKKEHVLIVDGQPRFEFEELLAGPEFSPDGQHIAYVDWSNGGFLGTLDGKSVAESKAPGYHTLSLGKYFAEQITFSADSQRLAYVVVSGGENYWEGATKRAKRRVVVDGHEHNLYDAYGINLTFSPDSRHVAYIVHGGLKKDKSTVVIDGREGGPYDSVLGGVFHKEVGADGGTSAEFVYIAREGRKFYRVTQPLP